MAIKIVPLRSADIFELKDKGVLGFYGNYVNDSGLLALEDNPYSMTIITADTEEVIACGGCVEVWENRGHLWFVVDQELATKNSIAIHNAVLRYISVLPFNRVEAVVEAKFKKANRWMELLKFKREGLLEAYDISGADMIMYAKIKGAK